MDIQKYLQTIPAARAERFNALRQLIIQLYPTADESMRYKMPTYELDEGWVALANQKQYISLYTCSSQHIESFKNKYPKIKTGKGCINFKDSDRFSITDLAPVIKSAIEYRH